MFDILEELEENTQEIKDNKGVIILTEGTLKDMGETSIKEYAERYIGMSEETAHKALENDIKSVVLLSEGALTKADNAALVLDAENALFEQHMENSDEAKIVYLTEGYGIGSEYLTEGVGLSMVKINDKIMNAFIVSIIAITNAIGRLITKLNLFISKTFAKSAIEYYNENKNKILEAYGLHADSITINSFNYTGTNSGKQFIILEYLRSLNEDELAKAIKDMVVQNLTNFAKHRGTLLAQENSFQATSDKKQRKEQYKNFYEKTLATLGADLAVPYHKIDEIWNKQNWFRLINGSVNVPGEDLKSAKDITELNKKLTKQFNERFKKGAKIIAHSIITGVTIDTPPKSQKRTISEAFGKNAPANSLINVMENASDVLAKTMSGVNKRLKSNKILKEEYKKVKKVTSEALKLADKDHKRSIFYKRYVYKLIRAEIDGYRKALMVNNGLTKIDIEFAFSIMKFYRVFRNASEALVKKEFE